MHENGTINIALGNICPQTTYPAIWNVAENNYHSKLIPCTTQELPDPGALA